jgi:hypothetical protein
MNVHLRRQQTREELRMKSTDDTNTLTVEDAQRIVAPL